jgi:hypothetical protein
MEIKPKSSAPTNSGSTPEVSISRQQPTLAGATDADFSLPQDNLPRRPFRFTEKTETTHVVEIVFLPEPLSDSAEEGLSELAQQVRPQLLEAGIIRPPENQAAKEDQPPKIVSRVTGVLAWLTRLCAALFELLKGLKRLLGI